MHNLISTAYYRQVMRLPTVESQSTGSTGLQYNIEYMVIEQYAAFRQHWHILQVRDFNRQVREFLET
jgi:hypothetical protein